MNALPIEVLRRLAKNPRAVVNGVRSGLELARGTSRCSSDPVMLQIEVTVRCNFRCHYCIVHNGTVPRASVPRDMSLDLYRSILDRFSRSSYIQLFGQGEPLLLKNRLIAMIQLAARERRFTALVTNGSLCNERTGRDLLKAGLGAIAFSLDLCSPSRMESTRIGMNADSVFQNLQRLLERRDREGHPTAIGVSAVLLQGTPREEVVEAVRRIDRLGVDFLMVGPLAGTSSYQTRYPGSMATQRLISVDAFEHLPDDTRCSIYTTPGSNTFRGRCVWPWSALYVNHDGTVSYCANNHRIRVSRNGGEEIVQATDGDVRNVPLFRTLRESFGRNEVPNGCQGCQYLLGPQLVRSAARRLPVDEGDTQGEEAPTGDPVQG